MQWDHLRTFEAVARAGSMTAAAVTLGISQSTVSRHLSALERSAGSPLVWRESPVRLTRRGAAVLLAVAPMVDAALAVNSAIEMTARVSGIVTVTSVGEVVRWMLTRRLPSLYRRHPDLRLRLLAANQLSSLAAGEADVALRFARPEVKGLVAQRLLTEIYGLYASESLPMSPTVDWLGLTGSLARVPEQRHAERIFADRLPLLLVEDVESLGLAVQTGLGVAVLPASFAAKLKGVVEVEPGAVGADGFGPAPTRDLWMVVHESRRGLPRVNAVMEWLVSGDGLGLPPPIE